MVLRVKSEIDLKMVDGSWRRIDQWGALGNKGEQVGLSLKLRWGGWWRPMTNHLLGGCWLVDHTNRQTDLINLLPSCGVQSCNI